MFEEDYIPSDDIVLQDRAYDALRDAPDMTDEMEMVARGEMTAAEFDRMTSRQEVGIEAFKLNREAGSVIPVIYNDGLAVTCDSNQSAVVCNMALIDKLLGIASTDEGWSKLSTAPLDSCAVVNPDTSTDILPRVIDGILYASKALYDIGWAYREVASDGDKWNAVDKIKQLSDGFNLQDMTISNASTVLDVYANMNTVGEVFTQEQFVEMLTSFANISKTFTDQQEEIYLKIITQTTGIIHKGYVIVDMASNGLLPEPEPIASLTRAAKYVEGTARLAGYASILSGRINELLGKVNKAVS